MASYVMQVPELAELILSFADIETIISVGRTNKQGGRIMRQALKDLIRNMLNPYFEGFDERQEFFKMLENTEGVITGSSTLKVLLPYERRRHIKTGNLNIVVPSGNSSAVVAFAEARQYIMKPIENSRPPSIKSCSRLVHRDSGAVILVTESHRSTVLDIVLYSANTACMNIITPRNVFSFYPKLTANGEASCEYVMATNEEVDKAKEWGIDLQRPLWHENEKIDCGIECPIRIRQIKGLEGIGVACWNKTGVEPQDIANQDWEWRLGTICVNMHCVLNIAVMKRDRNRG